jgi:hypothetical protein
LDIHNPTDHISAGSSIEISFSYPQILGNATYGLNQYSCVTLPNERTLALLGSVGKVLPGAWTLKKIVFRYPSETARQEGLHEVTLLTHTEIMTKELKFKIEIIQ